MNGDRGRRPGAGADRGDHSTEVPALLAGVRADRGVAMVADVSRAAAAQLIAAGRVLVDGSPVSAGREMLREGATLTIVLPAERAAGVAPEPGVRFEVVFADDAVVVVDKPAGLVVHPGAGHDEGTLVGGLLARFPDLAELVAAGRVPAGPARDRPPPRQGHVGPAGRGPDRGRLPGARRPVGDQDHGAPLPGAGRRRGGRRPGRGGGAHRPLHPHPDEDGGHRVGEAGPHRLHRPGAASGEQPTTLLELALQSGRTHQIRVHMAAIGHPVVGDARYGVADKRLGSGRFFLHAFKLAFVHPVTGARTEFTSPLPEDLEAYLGEPHGRCRPTT